MSAPKPHGHRREPLVVIAGLVVMLVTSHEWLGMSWIGKPLQVMARQLHGMFSG